jgi:hypothetical protein
MAAKFRDLPESDDGLQSLFQAFFADAKLFMDAESQYRKKGGTEIPPLEDLDGQAGSRGQKPEKTEQAQETGKKDIFLSMPVLMEDTSETEAAESSTAESAIFSRFLSYLENVKTNVFPRDSVNRGAPEEDEDVEGKKEYSGESSSKISRVPGQEESAVPAFSETPPRNGTAISIEGDFSHSSRGDLRRNTGFSSGALDADADLADMDLKEVGRLTGGKSAKEASAKQGTEAHEAGFEQFFDGVMARRGGVQGGDQESLSLGKGASLSGNEALREGLDNVVRFIRVSGEQRASLIVDPPALGRVSVELTYSAAGLEASIKVGNEQVRQLIQDQLDQLRWSLAQQGVQLAQFSVDVRQDDGRREQGQSSERGRRAEAAIGNDAGGDEETVFRVDLNQGLFYWVA